MLLFVSGDAQYDLTSHQYGVGLTRLRRTYVEECFSKISRVQ
jgi:hypothetical protein